VTDRQIALHDGPDCLGPQTPEEEELARIDEEIAELLDRLADAEERLANRHATLDGFRARYRAVVAGPKARVDALEAQLAAVLAAADPGVTGEAQVAQERAKASRDVADSPGDGPQVPPSEGARDLYRRVARLAHPDLAKDASDRTRRTKLMAEANDAYRNGDLAALSRIEAEAAADAPAGTSIGERLVAAIRRRAAAIARLAAVKLELVAIEHEPVAELQRRVDTAEAAGRDLLDEMATELGRRAASLEAKLATQLAAMS
jgi:hypothetical protein